MLISIHIFILSRVQDRKVWKEFKRIAFEAEEERLMNDLEDDHDLMFCDDIASIEPTVDAPNAKRALKRLASRTESILSIQTSSGNLYLPSPTSTIESPSKPAGRLPAIYEERPDVARDNILAHLSTSQGRESDYLASTTSETPILGTAV